METCPITKKQKPVGIYFVSFTTWRVFMLADYSRGSLGPNLDAEPWWKDQEAYSCHVLRWSLMSSWFRSCRSRHHLVRPCRLPDFWPFQKGGGGKWETGHACSHEGRLLDCDCHPLIVNSEESSCSPLPPSQLRSNLCSPNSFRMCSKLFDVGARRSKPLARSHCAERRHHKIEDHSVKWHGEITGWWKTPLCHKTIYAYYKTDIYCENKKGE